jgi:hypothetical protein
VAALAHMADRLEGRAVQPISRAAPIITADDATLLAILWENFGIDAQQ